MNRIVMLLSNPFRPDPRVLKEARSLADFGYEVSILCWDRRVEYPDQETLSNGIQVFRIQNIPSEYGLGTRQILRLPLFWNALQPYLEALEPDLVHCHDFDTLPAGLFWGKMHRIPVVYDAHEYYADLTKPRLHGLSGEFLYRTIRFAELRAARLSSAVITVDETLGSIYQELNSHTVIIGHYPPKTFVPEASPVFTQENLNLLYTGRLSRDRGMLYYIQLLRELREMDIPAKLHLVGTFTPDTEKQLFMDNLGDIHPHVEFHGWVSYENLPRLLKSADLGLAVLMPEPRYTASLPVKLFEYMAAGLPVMASNFLPIANIVVRVKCGLLVDPLGDPASAAADVASWWIEPEIPRNLGDNGRKAVLEDYNWERVSRQLDDLYQSLINLK